MTYLDIKSRFRFIENGIFFFSLYVYLIIHVIVQYAKPTKNNSAF